MSPSIQFIEPIKTHYRVKFDKNQTSFRPSFLFFVGNFYPKIRQELSGSTVKVEYCRYLITFGRTV